MSHTALTNWREDPGIDIMRVTPRTIKIIYLSDVMEFIDHKSSIYFYI